MPLALGFPALRFEPDELGVPSNLSGSLSGAALLSNGHDGCHAKNVGGPELRV